MRPQRRSSSNCNCPNAEIVFDLFHVVAKCGREVIDRVRVDQVSKLRDDKPARRVIKSSLWLLLRNRKNLDRGASGTAERTTGGKSTAAHHLPHA